jgi:hypothetical protein
LDLLLVPPDAVGEQCGGDVDEAANELVHAVEDEAVSEQEDGERERAVGDGKDDHERELLVRHDPQIGQAEEVREVAEVKEEILVLVLAIVVESKREQQRQLD